MFECLLQKEIDEIIEKAAFTHDQKQVFNALVYNELNDKGIIQMLNMERHKYYKVKKQVLDKVLRIIEKS